MTTKIISPFSFFYFRWRARLRAGGAGRAYTPRTFPCPPRACRLEASEKKNTKILNYKTIFFFQGLRAGKPPPVSARINMEGAKGKNHEKDKLKIGDARSGGQQQARQGKAHDRGSVVSPGGRLAACLMTAHI